MPPLVRIAITGSSGVYGRAVVREIRRSLPEATVLGLDRQPTAAVAPDIFWEGDIRTAEAAAAIDTFHPDTVIHLAYAVQPGRDLVAMESINVDGTRTVLAAAAGCGAARLLVASSGTIYGAWPDNPAVCDETTPLRPRPDYYYSLHKGIVEREVAAFAAAHPQIAVAWTRPAIICGPGVKNFLTDIFLTVPCLVLPDGRDTPLQFVHEDDVARGTLAILAHGGRGPFNIAPDDALSQRQLAEAMGIPVIPLPFFVVNGLARVWWTLRLPWIVTPPGLVHYLRHPWVMTSRRLAEECGFTCTHSSWRAFRTLLKPMDGADSHTAPAPPQGLP
jgi:UDP-glucose 4-epimerase